MINKFIILGVALVATGTILYLTNEPKPRYALLNNHDIELSLQDQAKAFESGQLRRSISLLKQKSGLGVDMAGTPLRFAYLGDTFLVISAGLDKNFGTEDDIQVPVKTKLQ
ncbi:MAG: hypothetical protein EOP04_09115 [Proteobacteria bacterium]|nr:MAG: hypothetical protein EOP04_09115 [Pseudomonadota bacterium]